MSDVLIGSDSRKKIIGSVPTRTPTHQLARYALFLTTHLLSTVYIYIICYVVVMLFVAVKH